MTDGNNLPIANAEERLRVLAERVEKLEQERSKGFIGRLFGGLGGAVVLAVFLGLTGRGASYAGYFGGNDYVDLSPETKVGYVTGAFDAFEVSNSLKREPLCLYPFVDRVSVL